jgi:hypothetical protein
MDWEERMPLYIPETGHQSSASDGRSPSIFAVLFVLSLLLVALAGCGKSASDLHKVPPAHDVQGSAAGESSQSAPSHPKTYHVFAVLDHRGTHYELSNEPVSTCVHLEGEDRWDWKLASITGRWMGTVKSCWYMAHREKERVNMGPGSKGDVIVTVPAHDEVVVCLPYARAENSKQNRGGPACQNIDPAYFVAVESLPHPAF